ncbi:MAG: ADP-ribosylglycohydrolase family protein, partial [Chloroflexota bacterium]
AYTTIGLLYGKGNFTKSVDIATRCGQDADCNAASVGGILGVMTGYSGIPAFWLKPLQEIEPLNFEGTEMSLSKAYEMSYKHALQVIKLAGGSIEDKSVTIPYQEPKAVAFEQNFDKTYPVAREKIDLAITSDYTFNFTGNGYILYGNLVKRAKVDPDYIDRVSKKLGSEVFGLAEPDDHYVAEV